MVGPRARNIVRVIICLCLSVWVSGSTHIFFRCMEHSLHLAAKHFVQSVSPVSPTSIQKKASAALKMARDDAHMSMDEFDRAMFVIDFNHIHEDDYFDHLSDGEGDDDGVDEDTDFTPGDSLGKALALVKQVRSFFPDVVTGTYFATLFSDSHVTSGKNFFQIFMQPGQDQAS